MLGFIEEFLSGELRYMPLVFLVSTLLATPVAGLILWLSTRWRHRRLAAGLWDDSPEAVIESGLHGTKGTHQLADQFSWHHLKSWHLMALAGLTAASATSLWLGWHVVVWALAAAALVSYLWHFKLRRSGIRWAGSVFVVLVDPAISGSRGHYRPLQCPAGVVWSVLFRFGRDDTGFPLVEKSS